jgi:hypothetical protein
MSLSATFTIDVSMIAMINPSIVVSVIRMTGTPPVADVVGGAGGRPAAARGATRDAMTRLPWSLYL